MAYSIKAFPATFLRVLTVYTDIERTGTVEPRSDSSGVPSAAAIMITRRRKRLLGLVRDLYC